MENEAGLKTGPLTLRAGLDGWTSVELIEHECLDFEAQDESESPATWRNFCLRWCVALKVFLVSGFSVNWFPDQNVIEIQKC